MEGVKDPVSETKPAEPATDELIVALLADIEREGGCSCPDNCIQYSCLDIRELIARIYVDKERIKELEKSDTHARVEWDKTLIQLSADRAELAKLRAEVEGKDKLILQLADMLESFKSLHFIATDDTTQTIVRWTRQMVDDLLSKAASVREG